MPERVGAWRIIQVPNDPSAHPRMQAKFFKLLSHVIFPGGQLADRYAPAALDRPADLSLWIDARLRITSRSFVRDMRTRLGEGDWSMFVHPDRDCIYEEARVSSHLPKYKSVPVLAQAEAYINDVPEHAGLYACGVIVRREPSSERLHRFHERWWREKLEWTYQDQLSLPYLLRAYDDCYPIQMPEHIRNEKKWFELVPHKSDL